MKKNKNKIEKEGLKMQCNLCVSNFKVWFDSLNYDDIEKEADIKNHLYNHCPVCKILKKRVIGANYF